MNSENEKKKKQSLRNNEYYDMQGIYDNLYKQSKENKEFKHLIEIISCKQNILLAYRNIKTNNGKDTPGVDTITMKHFDEMSVEEFVTQIRDSIEDYKPGKVRRVEIPKQDGGVRPLGIPCMIDRIIQQCILQVLDPICEAKFYNYSFGFRPNRSAHDAITRSRHLINSNKLHYAISIDIKGFFDNVDHSKLLKQLWTMGIKDKNLLRIIKKMLEAEIEGAGTPTKGTPQGGILSPLLANIVLNELDWWISNQWESYKTSHQYYRNAEKCRALRTSTNLKEMFLVRYADDFKIFCRNSKTAFKILNAVKRWLKKRLHLDINTDKTKVTNLRKNSMTFLGFRLKAKIKGKTKTTNPKWVCISHISDKGMSNIQDKLNNQIKNIQRNPIPKTVSLLNSMILGIQNYYNIASRVSEDLGRIDFNLSRIINNRLKPKDDGKHSISYLKLYAKYCKRKVMKVAGIDIYPIYGAYMKIIPSFNQNICNYTLEGRDLIHREIHTVDYLVKYLLGTSQNETVKYNDNRISLLYQQQGKCSISGLDLNTDTMQCHHRKPKGKGGTDEYKNLTYVVDFVHRLIHATEREKYLPLFKHLIIKMKLKTTDEFKNILKKVNSFRILAENFPLVLENIV